MLSRARLVLVLVIALLGSTLFAGGAAAADGKLGVAVRAGTYGLGADVAYGLTRMVTIRGSYQAFDVDESFEEGGINYDGRADIGGSGLYVDVFPLGGGFRITGGLLNNRNEITLSALATELTEIGGTIYTPAQVGTLSGTVDYNDDASYLGVGVGNIARGKRLGFVFDGGVVFQGSGDVTLASSTGLVDPADLAAEELQIEDDISSADVWPVVSFGLAIRF